MSFLKIKDGKYITAEQRRYTGKCKSRSLEQITRTNTRFSKPKQKKKRKKQH